MSTFEIIILAIIYIFCYSYLCASLIYEENTILKTIMLFIFIIIAPLAIIDIAIGLYIKLNK